MLKKENLRKNFLRVKQIADQNLGRAEKSEVLSEDLQGVEKRVELVKVVCTSTTKKLSSSLQGTGPDLERRLKKLPESQLAQNMIENASLLGDGIMGTMFQTCGECQYAIARHLLQYEYDVEKNVLAPLQEILDSEIPVITKAKKQLSKLTLDMDSARSRWNEAVKQAQVHGANLAAKSAKADQVKEEYEETCNRMYMARDNLATEMYNFVAKEAEHSNKLLEYLKAQKEFHLKALAEIDKVIPKMSESLECNPSKPVYGVSLEEHLRVTGRDIALVIEACVCTLIEGGLDEEGLFRIAGMASKVKKLKNAFDAQMIDMEEYGLDLHSVAGALKQYLRELPEPLLTTSLHSEFLKASQMSQDQKLQFLWSALRTIPDINYNNFRYLIKFLAKLAARSNENKMTPSNIAIVIGPNLLWSEEDNGPNMVTSGTISNLIELIITHADWFFPEEIDFHQTLHGTAPPKSPGANQSSSSTPVTATVYPMPHNKRQGYVGNACGMPSHTAAGLNQDSTSANPDDRMPREGSSDANAGSPLLSFDDSASSTFSPPNVDPGTLGSEEVTFKSLEALGLKSSTGNTDQTDANNTEIENPSEAGSKANRLSGGTSPNASTSNLATDGSGNLAPLAEDEETSPKAQKRIPRKPAPRPPDRPYSIAVTAMGKSQPVLAQTWPRKATTPTQESFGNHTEDTKPRSPDKPTPPEKPSTAPHRASTMSDKHSHHDRPTVPPPERPKLPPPAVPSHQRSASAGSASNIVPTLTPELTPKTQNSENEQGENKVGTL